MERLEKYGPIEALQLGRRLLGLGPPIMTVRCYAVDGLLVDTGLSPLYRAVLAFARERGVKQAAVTHHHEDHSGNARALRDAGVEVFASTAAADLLASGFETRWYQRRAWGVAPRVEVKPLGGVVETPRHRFEVLPAPGHCDDQVVFYERSRGWLFSGDAFLADRVKLFRGDEDFAGTLATLRRLVELDFDSLFCAHRPVLQGGREALRRKLAYLTEVEGRVRDLAASGRSIDEIARRVLGAENRWMVWFSRGDLSKRNLVRSILHGAVPRGG